MYCYLNVSKQMMDIVNFTYQYLKPFNYELKKNKLRLV